MQDNPAFTSASAVVDDTSLEEFEASWRINTQGLFVATQQVLDDMRTAGVETNAHTDKGTDLPTGTCLVMVTPDADRTMNTSLGISATLTPDQVVEDELKASEYLYVEGYLVSTPTSLRTALRARKVAAGVTSMEEVLRVTQDQSEDDLSAGATPADLASVESLSA